MARGESQHVAEGEEKPPPTLRQNFAWTFAGNVVFAMCQWAVLVAITKFGSTQAVGDWTLALALTAPVFIFSQFKLRYVQVTDVRHEFMWGEYLALRLLGSSGAVLVVTAIVAIGYREPVAWVILMIAVSKAFDGASDLIYGQEQQREQMDRIAQSQIVRGLSSLVAAVSLLWWTRSAAWAAAATACTYAGWLVWDYSRLRALFKGESLRPQWDRRGLFRLFRRVLPLGFVTAIGSLQVNVPRYFLEGYSSREDLGVFGTMSYLLVFGNMVITAIQGAALPRMSRQAAAGEWKAFRRNLHRMHLIGFALGVTTVVGSLLVGAPVLRIIYSNEVARHADVLVWLCLTSWFLWTYTFLGTALDAMRRFHIQPWIHGTSTAIIALASLILVPRYGMRGAAWAMLIGYGLESVFYYVAVALPLRQMERERGSHG